MHVVTSNVDVKDSLPFNDLDSLPFNDLDSIPFTDSKTPYPSFIRSPSDLLRHFGS